MSSEQFNFSHHDDQALTGQPDSASEFNSTRFEQIIDPSVYQERGERTLEAYSHPLSIGDTPADPTDLSGIDQIYEHPLSIEATPGSDEPAPESSSTAQEQEQNYNKLKPTGFRKLKALAVGLAFAAALTACSANTSTADTSEPLPEPPAAEQVDESLQRPVFDESQMRANMSESLTGSEILDAMIDGSFNQYDNPGGHDIDYRKDPTLKQQGRPDIYSAGSVANVADVLTFMNNNNLIADPANITPEEYGTAYKFVVFSEKEPAAYVAIGAGMEGFEDLSYKEAVAKIDNMDAVEKSDFQADLQHVFDRTNFSESSVKGEITNYYIVDNAKGEKQGEAHTTYLDGPTSTLVMSVSNQDIYGDDTYMMTDDGRFMPASAYYSENTNDDGETRTFSILKRCFNGDKEVAIIDNASGNPGKVVINETTPTVTTQPDTTPAVVNNQPQEEQPQEDQPASTPSSTPSTGKPAGGNPNQDNPSTGKPAGGNPNQDQPTDTTPSTPEPSNPGKPAGGDPGQDNPPDTPPSIPDNPGTNDPNPPTPPAQTVVPKDENAEREHAGPDITPAVVDNVVTPPTSKQEDQQNFTAIYEQQQEDQRRQQEAAAEAERQRQAEAEARRQAELRRQQEEEAERQRQAEAAARAQAAADEAERQRLIAEEQARQAAEAEAKRQADEAAARAQAEAQRRQEEAAEAERQRQAEEEARRRAQEEADRLAAEQAAEAASHADDTAGERADLFNNGDF